jgi:hypothetical protein
MLLRVHLIIKNMFETQRKRGLFFFNRVEKNFLFPKEKEENEYKKCRNKI